MLLFLLSLHTLRAQKLSEPTYPQNLHNLGVHMPSEPRNSLCSPYSPSLQNLAVHTPSKTTHPLSSCV